MPGAVVHILLAIILIDIFRDYFMPKHHMHKFPRWMVLIGGIAGLLPDLDLPLGWVSSLIWGQDYYFHTGITHTFMIPFVFLLIASLLYFIKKDKSALLLTIIAAGYSLHIILDFFVLGGSYAPFFPLSTLTLPRTFIDLDHVMGLDAIIFILWLFYEEFKNKIKDYI